jgi:hypothetical protein
MAKADADEVLICFATRVGTEMHTFVFLNSFFYCTRRAGIRG